ALCMISGTAAKTSTRGVVTPVRSSKIGLPLCLRIDSISSAVADGLTPRSTAAAPAACGDACDVPAYVDRRPPRPSDVIQMPGASRSSVAFELLKQAILSAAVAGALHFPPLYGPMSASYTAPTEIASCTHAGAPMFVAASLPLQ